MLEEFCNIGKLPDFKRVLNFCRGSGIFCQLIVQSIPQLQDRYPKTEWEELIGCTDIQICLGCNDVDTATYISKCGMVTIKVENNQMPLCRCFLRFIAPPVHTARPRATPSGPSCSRMKVRTLQLRMFRPLNRIVGVFRKRASTGTLGH